MNVAYGESHALNELLARTHAPMGCEIRALYVTPRLGEVGTSAADISQARTRLGYVPSLDLTESLGRTVEWFCADEGLPPQIHERRRWLARA